jgi:hypothetical protein
MFTFGADPEFILEKDGIVYSSIGIISNKDDCYEEKGHKFYYDNVLAECAIKPSGHEEEAIGNFRECFKIFSKLISPYKLSSESTNSFSVNELNHPVAKEVGCKGEWCAYDLIEVDPPDIKNYSFRTAGGHIHLGSNEEPLNNGFGILFTIRMLDLFLGLPFVLIEEKTNRRTLFGHAGRHRVTNYGLEYRTLSNHWLKSPKLVSLVHRICSFTLDFVKEGNHFGLWSVNENLLNDDDPSKAHHCIGYDVEELKYAINSSDKRKAKKFMLLVENILPSDIAQTLTEEIDKKDEYDLYKEWSIKN